MKDNKVALEINQKFEKHFSKTDLVFEDEISKSANVNNSV